MNWLAFFAYVIVMKKEIREAIAEATKRGKLRTNSVNSLTGENASDNLGPGTPTMHFDQWENTDEIEVKLLLKGGGCENKNIQYSLPMELPHLGKAGRDLDGVRKCILHAVWQAQGQGCSAGAIGVCIGGDRAQGCQPPAFRAERGGKEETQQQRQRDTEHAQVIECNNWEV